MLLNFGSAYFLNHLEAIGCYNIFNHVPFLLAKETLMKLSFAMIGLLALSSEIIAQNAAVSSYLNPQSTGNVDVRIREVRMPSAGLYIGTYWCTLGYWTTGTTSGYGGMQWTSDASQGPKNFIYSQWNDFSTAAYNDPATQVKTFGGEGTGVKSVNNDSKNQWKPDFWHVNADRVWGEGANTHFAYIERNGETKVWKHIMTWKTPEANLKFSSAGYMFIEDWTGDGNYRESQVRKGWNRNPTGVWTPTTTYKYNVNAGDLAVGKRSYNKRTNWAGGIKTDTDGSKFFYMGAGGSVVSTNNDQSNHTIARTEKAPQEEYGTAVVSKLVANVIAGNKLEVIWVQDSTTVPQWSYKLSVKNGATVLLTKSDTLPQCRKDTIALGALTPATTVYTLTLEVTDFFDGKAPVKSLSFGKGAVNTISDRAVNRANWNIQQEASQIHIWSTDIKNVNLLSVTGQNVAQGQAFNDHWTVNAQNMPNGIYALQIQTAGGNSYQKIVLNH